MDLSYGETSTNLDGALEGHGMKLLQSIDVHGGVSLPLCHGATLPVLTSAVQVSTVWEIFFCLWSFGSQKKDMAIGVPVEFVKQIQLLENTPFPW